MRNIISFKNKRSLILVLFLIGCLSYIGYIQLKNTPCPEYPVAIPDSPEFIKTVWPAPESEIQFACYVGCYIRKYPTLISPHSDSCVNVYIVPTRKFFDIELHYQELNPDKEFPPFEDRVSLYVDGKQRHTILTRPMGALPLDGDINSGLELWYWFGSHPLLFPGDHNARVVIELKNGEVFEYEWRFKIK